MSFFEQVSGQSFAIFQGNEAKENSEATNYNNKKGSLISARPPLQERTQLVQNGSNNPFQPSGKQKTFGTENCAVKCFNQQSSQSTKPIHQPQSFAIFEDDTSLETLNPSAASIKDSCDDEEMDLHPAFTTVFKPEGIEVSKVDNYSLDLDDSMKAGSSMCLCTPDEEMLEEEHIEEIKCKNKNLQEDKHLWFPEYQCEIYKYLRETETRHAVRPDYMRKQAEITYNMRSILVDWMVEVGEEYKLDRETICLSVSYVDRFLSVMAVARNKLQLVGTAAMFIAAKYEEIYPPDLGEFVYITDNSYTKKQVLQMERLILRTLSFNIASPTVNCFCTNLFSKLSSDEKTSSLALYLLELSMLDAEKFLKFTPSVIATSCVCLAHHIMGESGFMSDISDHTGYNFDNLISCVADLVIIFKAADSLQHPAIREKFAKDKWNRVSEISSSWPGSVPTHFS